MSDAHYDTTPPAARQVLLEEPFRLFFPLGAVAAVAGVGPWLLFHLGLQQVYPIYLHGLLQIQGFEMTFASGFLMTALPRFLESHRTQAWELVLAWLLCAGVTVALSLGRIVVGEALALALGLHLTLFTLHRLWRRGDDPPPYFAFVPVGLASAVAGAALILWPAAAWPRLGELLVHEGVFLGFVLAIGSHLGPRLLHGPRGFPETTTPAAHRRLALLLALGLILLATFPLQAAGHLRAGPGLRALVVTAYLVGSLRVYRRPLRPLLHLHLLRLAFWSIPGGLWLAAVDPVHAVAALHLTYAGGFGLITFVIATRVTVGHAGFEDLWDRHRAAVVVPLSLITLSVPVRLAADAVPGQRVHLVVAAAGLWLAGVVVWAAVFVPRLSTRYVAPD